MSAGYFFTGADPEDLQQLQAAFDRSLLEFVRRRPGAAGSVVPRWMEGDRVNAALLDLLVLAFSHVTLDVNMLEEPYDQFGDKLDAYAEAGVVTFCDFTWSSLRSLDAPEFRFMRRLPVLSAAEVLPSGSWSPLNLLDIATDLRTLAVFRRGGKQFARRLQEIESMYPNGEGRFRIAEEVRRGSRVLLIARAVGGSSLGDEITGNLVELMSQENPLDRIDRRRGQAVASAQAWYAGKLESVPDLRDPTQVLRFRADHASTDFLNEIANAASADEEGVPLDELERRVSSFLETRLSTAKRLSSRSVRLGFGSIGAASGTLGGVVGGPLGAIAGGLAGRAVGDVLDAKTKAAVAPWTSYFLKSRRSSS